MPEVAADDTLVTARQAAEILGVSLRTVERMQADGDLKPVYLPTPRRAKLRRFRLADVEARTTPTPGGGATLPAPAGTHTQQAANA